VNQTLLHGQGADDEQSGSDQSNTPKRRNWPRTRNPFIDDEAGVAQDGDDDDVEYDNNTDDQSLGSRPALSYNMSYDSNLLAYHESVDINLPGSITIREDAAKLFMDDVENDEYQNIARNCALAETTLCFRCNRGVNDECSMTIADFSSNYPHLLTFNGMSLCAFDEANQMRRICQSCEREELGNN